MCENHSTHTRILLMGARRRDSIDGITGNSRGGGDRTAVADDHGLSDAKEVDSMPLLPDESTVQ